jgi:hypothetical protein
MSKPLAVAVTALAAAMLTPGAISWLNDRPIRGPLQYWLFHDDTQYAPKYSERAFTEVRAGMLRAEVERLLGPPLRIIHVDNGRIVRMTEPGAGSLLTYPDLPPNIHHRSTGAVYFYSWPRKESGNWFVRSVAFSTNEQVEQTTRVFEVD